MFKKFLEKEGDSIDVSGNNFFKFLRESSMATWFKGIQKVKMENFLIFNRGKLKCIVHAVV
jgi:hypothetical protein